MSNRFKTTTITGITECSNPECNTVLRKGDTAYLSNSGQPCCKKVCCGTCNRDDVLLSIGEQVPTTPASRLFAHW